MQLPNIPRMPHAEIKLPAETSSALSHRHKSEAQKLQCLSLLLCLLLVVAEVLAVYEDEVVRLQLLMRQQGTARGVPGIMYELADLQVTCGSSICLVSLELACFPRVIKFMFPAGTASLLPVSQGTLRCCCQSHGIETPPSL